MKIKIPDPLVTGDFNGAVSQAGAVCSFLLSALRLQYTGPYRRTL